MFGAAFVHRVHGRHALVRPGAHIIVLPALRHRGTAAAKRIDRIALVAAALPLALADRDIAGLAFAVPAERPAGVAGVGIDGDGAPLLRASGQGQACGERERRKRDAEADGHACHARFPRGLFLRRRNAAIGGSSLPGGEGGSSVARTGWGGPDPTRSPSLRSANVPSPEGEGGCFQ